MVGIFAFQAALNLCSRGRPLPAAPPRLHPRPRDCVVLAGRGYSNKQIARALALTPRTVDGYLTDARRLFEAPDRSDKRRVGQVCISPCRSRLTPYTYKKKS